MFGVRRCFVPKVSRFGANGPFSAFAEQACTVESSTKHHSKRGSSVLQGHDTAISFLMVWFGIRGGGAAPPLSTRP